MKKEYKYYIIICANLILLLLCWGFLFYYQYNLQQSQIKIFKFLYNLCKGIATILPILIVIMFIRFLFYLIKVPQFHRIMLILITMFVLFINYNIIKFDRSGYVEDGEFLIINKDLNNNNYYIDVINKNNGIYTYNIICSSKQYKESHINNIYHISYISRDKFGKRLILIEKWGETME